MKLYFMKREALDMLKANLNMVYNKYFTEKNNKWLWTVYGGNPFVEFKEIDDFELTTIDEDTTKGEAEFNNCKILYERLSFITESQACDERLWAGLCHSIFYDYLRKRYDYDKKVPKTQKEAVSNIKSRFFFSGGVRAGLYRNAISKCWWVGHNTYDPRNANRFEMLDIIGSNDISSKISDIFYSNNFSANPVILEGIVSALKYFKDEDININLRNHIRPSMQLLNAIGGGVILDCLDQEEIADIVIDNIYAILQGDQQSLEESEDEKNELEISTEQDEEIVTIGSYVRVKEEKDITRIIKADYLPGSSKIPILAKSLLGKKKGESVEVNGKHYEIISVNETD